MFAVFTVTRVTFWGSAENLQVLSVWAQVCPVAELPGWMIQCCCALMSCAFLALKGRDLRGPFCEALIVNYWRLKQIQKKTQRQSKRIVCKRKRQLKFYFYNNNRMTKTNFLVNWGLKYFKLIFISIYFAEHNVYNPWNMHVHWCKHLTQFNSALYSLSLPFLPLSPSLDPL